MAQGQTATFAITWYPVAPAGDSLVLYLTGIATGRAAIAVPATATAATGTLPIPATFPDGTIQLHATLQGDSASASLVVLDTIAPSVGNDGFNAWVLPALPLAPIPMTLGGASAWNAFGGVTFIAGGADSAQFTASDNHGLAWAGWSLSAPANLRDSVKLTSLDTGLSIPMPIPTALAGTIDSVEFFVRDVDNNLSTYSLGPAAIALYADHPMTQSAHPTPVNDLTFDTKHSVVLVADSANRQVEVYNIPALTLKTTVTFPSAPVSVDVTPGGDSALVLLDSAGTVAVVNLATGYSFTTFSLPFSIDSNYPTDTVKAGWTFRIAADDRAIITMRTRDNGVVTLVEVNLNTDSTRIVVPAVSSGGYNNPTMRSPDGSLVIMPQMPYPAVNLAVTYTASTHAYNYTTVQYNSGSTSPGGAGYLPSLDFTMSNAPYYALTANQLFYTLPNAIGAIGLVNWFSGAIGPNGRDVYMPASPCTNPDTPCLDSAAATIIHYRVPDYLVPSRGTIGQPLDIFDAPEIARSLAVSPDGNTLIAVGPTALMAFDLTRSAPPSARVVRAPVVAASRGVRRAARPIPLAAPVAPPAPGEPSKLSIKIGRFEHAR